MLSSASAGDSSLPSSSRVELKLIIRGTEYALSQGDSLFAQLNDTNVPDVIFTENTCTMLAESGSPIVGRQASFQPEQHNPVIHGDIEELVDDMYTHDYRIIRQFHGSEFIDIDPLNVECLTTIETFLSSAELNYQLTEDIGLHILQPEGFIFRKLIIGGKCGRFYNSLRCLSALMTANNGNKFAWLAIRIARLTFLRTLELTSNTFCAVASYCVVLSLLIYSLIKSTYPSKHTHIFRLSSDFHTLKAHSVVRGNKHLHEMLFGIKNKDANSMLNLRVPLPYVHHKASDPRINSYTTNDNIPYPLTGVDTDRYAERIALQLSLPTLIRLAKTNNPLEILRLLVAPSYIYRTL